MPATTRNHTRWARAIALACALVLTPSGAAHASEPAKLVGIGDAWVVEPDSETRTVRVPVRLVRAQPTAVSVDVATEQGSATAADFEPTASSVVVIPAGATRAYAQLVVTGDLRREGTESFGVRILSATASPAPWRPQATKAPPAMVVRKGKAQLAVSGYGTPVGVEDAEATVRIADNEELISASAADVVVTEGNSGSRDATFTVALSRDLAAGQTVRVDYATADATATAGSADYAPRSGSLTFDASSRTRTVSVPVTGDLALEANETFELRLSTASSVIGVVDDAATATIVSDDGLQVLCALVPSLPICVRPAPSIQIDDAGAVEPATGGAQLRFRAWLASPAAQSMSVSVATDAAASTATAGSDYVPLAPRTVTFAPGASEAFVDVPLLADSLNEAPEERVALTLSAPAGAVLADQRAVGRIVDAQGPLRARVEDVAVDEGDDGASTATSTIRVEPLGPGQSVRLQVATADVEASASDDYGQTSGSRDVTASTGAASVDVRIDGDRRVEPDERVALRVLNPPDDVVVEDQGTITIRNDDVPPVSVEPVRIVGELRAGATVTVDRGRWSGKGDIQLAQQWERCSRDGACADIAGATGEAYEIAAADAGSALRVAVTATNYAGSTVARSPLTTTIARKPYRGQDAKQAAVQALIGGSLFQGDCSERCDTLLAREAANTDPVAGRQMATLRSKLGLLGELSSPSGALAAAAAEDIVSQFSRRIFHFELRGDRAYAIVQVRFGRSIYAWRWKVPRASIFPAHFMTDLEDKTFPYYADEVQWQDAGTVNSQWNYVYPQTGWYGSHVLDEFRWAENGPNEWPRVCDGTYSPRPRGDVEGFEKIYWTGPSQSAGPNNYPRECSSRNGSMMARDVGPIGPLVAWSIDDGTPGGVLPLGGGSGGGSGDPGPEPPDPVVLEDELCPHLLSGEYEAADVLLDNPCDEEVAVAVRPYLMLDESERWRPLEITRFLAEGHGVCADGAEGDCPRVYTAEALRGFAAGYHINVNGNSEDTYRSPDPACTAPNGSGRVLQDCDSGPASAMYYHVGSPSPQGYRYVDYWWYFRYNDTPLDVFDHEGDWEGVSVAPSKDAAPGSFDFANFSGHGHRFSYLRDNLGCEGGPKGSCGTDGLRLGSRVNVFAASGSHANYGEPCTGVCTQTNTATPELNHGGEEPWGNNDDESALLRFPDTAPSGVVWALGPQQWTDWPGHWGRVDGVDSDGPASPGNQHDFKQPWENDCADDDDCPAQRAGGAPAAGSASSKRPAPADDPASACASWFGSGVAALACQERSLEDALTTRSLGRRGALALQRRGTQAATAPGIAQLMGAPLRAGDTLTIRGRSAGTTTLLIRIAAGRRTYVAQFSFGSLRKARSHARVLVRRPAAASGATGSSRAAAAPTVVLELPDGSTLRPVRVTG